MGKQRRPGYTDKSGIKWDTNDADYEGFCDKRSKWMAQWRTRFFMLKGEFSPLGFYLYLILEYFLILCADALLIFFHFSFVYALNALPRRVEDIFCKR